MSSGILSFDRARVPTLQPALGRVDSESRGAAPTPSAYLDDAPHGPGERGGPEARALTERKSACVAVGVKNAGFPAGVGAQVVLVV
jgi:hypothetical protein